MPPLRERPEDVLPLAEHYLRYFRRRQGRPRLEFSLRCLAALSAHSWPGNLRELRNAVERAIILSPSDLLEPQDLGLPAVDTPGTTASAGPIVLGSEVSLDEIEREHLARVVARAPSFEAAARILGIDATTLQRKRKRYGLA
jgi:NtrC-family two-component system response regulator AlgB